MVDAGTRKSIENENVTTFSMQSERCGLKQSESLRGDSHGAQKQRGLQCVICLEDFRLLGERKFHLTASHTSKSSNKQGKRYKKLQILYL